MEQSAFESYLYEPGVYQPSNEIWAHETALILSRDLLEWNAYQEYRTKIEERPPFSSKLLHKNLWERFYEQAWLYGWRGVVPKRWAYPIRAFYENDTYYPPFIEPDSITQRIKSTLEYSRRFQKPFPQKLSDAVLTHPNTDLVKNFLFHGYPNVVTRRHLALLTMRPGGLSSSSYSNELLEDSNIDEPRSGLIFAPNGEVVETTARESDDMFLNYIITGISEDKGYTESDLFLARVQLENENPFGFLNLSLLPPVILRPCDAESIQKLMESPIYR